MSIWVAACVAIAVAGLAIALFNDLVTGRNAARAAWSDIDVQLQRRHDLIPALVAVVKGYAQHEQATLEAVTQLRAQAVDAATVARRGELEGDLATQLTRVIALGERYPDLKASTNFLQLQHDLVDTEDRLQQARHAYNEAVRAYNTAIDTFPDVILARPFGFRALDYFQAEGGAAAAPRVE